MRLRPKKSRRRGVDYSADIPFEKKPAPGESGVFKLDMCRVGCSYV